MREDTARAAPEAGRGIRLGAGRTALGGPPTGTADDGDTGGGSARRSEPVRSSTFHATCGDRRRNELDSLPILPPMAGPIAPHPRIGYVGLVSIQMQGIAGPDETTSRADVAAALEVAPDTDGVTVPR